MPSTTHSPSPDVLTGVERHFDRDEIVVSKTDPKGRITYANRTFLQLSDFTEAEVLGAPHSIIRHPEMPSCIFELMWSTILDGREIFAYVVNRSQNGDHYWVLAHVTPTFEAGGAIVGFHSNRRCPAREAVDTVSSLYGELRAIERGASSPKEGLAAARARLDDEVEASAKSYAEFVFGL